MTRRTLIYKCETMGLDLCEATLMIIKAFSISGILKEAKIGRKGNFQSDRSRGMFISLTMPLFVRKERDEGLHEKGLDELRKGSEGVFLSAFASMNIYRRAR